MIMHFFTLLISLSGIIKLILASPVTTGDGDDQAHALDDWINRSTGAVSIGDNPNKKEADDCSVVNLEGANIPGKVSYPRDCTTLSVWKNSLQEDGNALVGNPDYCKSFSLLPLFLFEGYALYPFASSVITTIQIKALSRKSCNAV